MRKSGTHGAATTDLRTSHIGEISPDSVAKGQDTHYPPAPDCRKLDDNLLHALDRPLPVSRGSRHPNMSTIDNTAAQGLNNNRTPQRA